MAVPPKPHIAIILSLTRDYPAYSADYLYFGLNISTSLVAGQDDNGAALASVFQPWNWNEITGDDLVAITFNVDDTTGAVQGAGNAVPFYLPRPKGIASLSNGDPGISKDVGWDLLTARLNEAVAELIDASGHLWDPEIKPDEEEDNRRRLRDLHANLSTMVHPTGYYANVTRAVRIEWGERAGPTKPLRLFVAPKIHFDAVTLEPDPDEVPQVALQPDGGQPLYAWKYRVEPAGALGGKDVYAYLFPYLEDWAPPPVAATSGEPILLNLQNHWIRQRTGTGDCADEGTDVPWFADDWTVEIEPRAANAFDLAQRIIDWFRQHPDANVETDALRRAILTALCDTANPGILRPPSGQSLLETWIPPLKPAETAAELRDGIAARDAFRDAVMATHRQLTVEDWAAVVKQALPQVADLRLLDFSATASALQAETLLGESDRLQSVLAEDRNLVQLILQFWDQAALDESRYAGTAVTLEWPQVAESAFASAAGGAVASWVTELPGKMEPPLDEFDNRVLISTAGTKQSVRARVVSNLPHGDLRLHFRVARMGEQGVAAKFAWKSGNHEAATYAPGAGWTEEAIEFAAGASFHDFHLPIVGTDDDREVTLVWVMEPEAVPGSKPQLVWSEVTFFATSRPRIHFRDVAERGRRRGLMTIPSGNDSDQAAVIAIPRILGFETVAQADAALWTWSIQGVGNQKITLTGARRIADDKLVLTLYVPHETPETAAHQKIYEVDWPAPLADPPTPASLDLLLRIQRFENQADPAWKWRFDLYFFQPPGATEGQWEEVDGPWLLADDEVAFQTGPAWLEIRAESDGQRVRFGKPYYVNAFAFDRGRLRPATIWTDQVRRQTAQNLSEDAEIRRHLLHGALGAWWQQLNNLVEDPEEIAEQSVYSRRFVQTLREYFEARFVPSAEPGDESDYAPLGTRNWFGDADADVINSLKDAALRYVTARIDPRKEGAALNGQPHELPLLARGRSQPQALAIQVDRLASFGQDDASEDPATANGDFLRRIAGVGMLCRIADDTAAKGPGQVHAHWRCLNTVQLLVQVGENDPQPLFDREVLVPYRLGYVNDKRETVIQYNNQPLLISDNGGELTNVRGHYEEEPADQETRYLSYQYRLAANKEDPGDDWTLLPELLYGRTFEVLAFIAGNTLALPKELAPTGKEMHPADMRYPKEFSDATVWPCAKREHKLSYLRQVHVGQPRVFAANSTGQDLKELDKVLPPIPQSTHPIARELRRDFLLPGFDDEGRPSIQRTYEGTLDVHGMRAQPWEISMRGVSFRSLLPRTAGEDVAYSVQLIFGTDREAKVYTGVVRHRGEELRVVWSAEGQTPIEGVCDLAGRATFNLRIKYLVSADATQDRLQLCINDSDIHEPDRPPLIALDLLWVAPPAGSAELDVRLSVSLGHPSSGDNEHRLLGALAYEPPTRRDSLLKLAPAQDEDSVVSDPEIPLLLLTPDNWPWRENPLRSNDEPRLREPGRSTWLQGRDRSEFDVRLPTVDIENWLRWWPVDDEGHSLPSDEATELRQAIWAETLQLRDESDERGTKPSGVAALAPDDPALQNRLVIQLIPIATQRALGDPAELWQPVHLKPTSDSEKLKAVRSRALQLKFAQVRFSGKLINVQAGNRDDQTDTVEIQILEGEIWELRIWPAVHQRWFDDPARKRFDTRLKRFGTLHSDHGEDYYLFSPLRLLIEGAVDALADTALLVSSRVQSEVIKSNAYRWLRELQFDVRVSTPADAAEEILGCHVAVVGPDVTQAEVVSSKLQNKRVPIVVWNRAAEFYSTGGLIPGITLGGSGGTQLKLTDFAKEEELTGGLPDEFELQVGVPANCEAVAAQGLETVAQLTGGGGLVLAAERLAELAGSFRPPARRIAFLLPDGDDDQVRGPEELDPIQQLFKAAVAWAGGPRLTEALWTALGFELERGAKARDGGLPPERTDLARQDTLTARLHRNASPRLRYVADVDLIRQLWRWTGLPVTPFPFPPSRFLSPDDPLEYSLIDRVPRLLADASPDAAMSPVLWDAEGFAMRTQDDHMRIRTFVPLDEPAKSLNLEQLVYDSRARYDRYSLVAYSRYRGLALRSSALALRNTSYTRRGAMEETDRWRRVLIPCRWPVEAPGKVANVSRPVVQFVLPLTEAMDIAADGEFCKQELEPHTPAARRLPRPRLLVVLGEPWFEHAGLAEMLDVDVELKPVKLNNDWRLLPEYGPDSILDASELDPMSLKLPNVICDVTGPIGTTFDTSTEEPLFVRSWFVVEPHVYVEQQERYCLDWHFFKLRFRRRLSSDALADEPAEPMEGGWESRSPRQQWGPASFVFRPWTEGLNNDEAPAVEITAAEVGNGCLNFQVADRSAASAGGVEVHSFSPNIPWRLAGDADSRTYAFQFIFQRGEMGDPKLAAQSGAAADETKVHWSVAMAVRADARAWIPIARLHWYDARKLTAPTPSLVSGTQELLQKPPAGLLQSKLTDAVWIQVLPNSRQVRIEAAADGTPHADAVPVSDLSIIPDWFQYPDEDDSPGDACANAIRLRCKDTPARLLTQHYNDLGPAGPTPPRSEFVTWLALTEVITDAFGKRGHERFIGVFQAWDDVLYNSKTDQDRSQPGLYVPMAFKENQGGLSGVDQTLTFAAASELRARIVTVQVRNREDRLGTGDFERRVPHWHDLFRSSDNARRNEDEEVRVVSVSPPIEYQPDRRSLICGSVEGRG